MKVSDFDEKQFINEVIGRYARTAIENEKDDCVVIDLNSLTNSIVSPRYLVYSIDHPGIIDRPLNSQISRFCFYGRWIAACTLGDVVAMGGQPKGFALDLSMPNDQDVKEIDSMLSGITDVLNAYGAIFEGGNIDNGPLETVGFAWGVVSERLVKRSGAIIGDKIIVTAPMGTGWASWISRKFDNWEKLSLNTRDYFLNYNSFPVAPIDPILTCAKKGYFTSGMDLTDGIIEFAYTISVRNGCSVIIDEKLLSPSKYIREVAKLLGINANFFCLEPGYDTPLIHGYTAKSENVDHIKNEFLRKGYKAFVVGEVMEGEGVWYKDKRNKLIALPMFWDNQFSKEKVIERWITLTSVLNQM